MKLVKTLQALGLEKTQGLDPKQALNGNANPVKNLAQAPELQPGGLPQQQVQAGHGTKKPSDMLNVRGAALNKPGLGKDWQTIAPNTLVGPAVPAEGVSITESIQRGQPVKATIKGKEVAGSLGGYDYRGRPVINTDEGRRIADWKKLEVVGAQQEVALPSAKLSKNSIIKPPKKLGEALNASFDTEVCGKHTAREYINALHDAGYFVYLCGGAIRDAIHEFHTKPDATTEELIETLKDIDIVTSAPPPVVREIAQKIAPEYKDGAVWSPPIVDQFGSVLIGGPKAGLPNPEGLDVTSIRSEGAHTTQIPHSDTGEKVFPYTFDHEIEDDTKTRDFACNSLYYDPLNKVLLDPTGKGIEHSQNRQLRVADRDNLSQDDSAALRFWKFRLRGFTATEKDTKDIRYSANKRLWAQPRWQLVLNITRVVPKDAKTREDVENFFNQLKGVMIEDGCTRLFYKRVLPMLDQVAKKVEKRAAREAAQ